MTRRARFSCSRPLIALVSTALLALLVSWPAYGQSNQRVPGAGGDRLWLARYSGPGTGADVANDLALSPDGSMVFVTGSSAGPSSDLDYATIAYDAATGDRVWGSRYNGPGDGTDVANVIDVSPDGSLLFVTGYSTGVGTSYDFATLAYDAGTGARLWTARWDHGGGTDIADALAVSPDGSAVFVTGESNFSFNTIAYAAATGARLWDAHYHGPGNGQVDVPYAIGVSPDGSTVFVTGESTEGGGATYFDWATIAYDTSTGTRQWLRRYDSHQTDDLASDLEVSPDGSTVYVGGYSSGGSLYSPDYLTVAYQPATGAALWGRFYDAARTYDVPSDLALTPDGSTVFVTGRSGEYGFADYSTIALQAATGKPLWKAIYDGPQGDEDIALAMGVSPDGSTVFVTGESGLTISPNDYATLAYDTQTGAQLWLDRYGTPEGNDIARALGVSTDGTTIFVTGQAGTAADSDFVTIAYDAGP